jgi:acetyl esterase/lipase
MLSRLLLTGILVGTVAQGKISPPQQPSGGPGSAESKYTMRKSTQGEGAKQYWLYEPDGLRGSAPVVIFLHGWNATNPQDYEAWIEHFVRRGNIVIYPRYQEGPTERIPNMMPNAIEAIRDGLSKLGSRADRNRFGLVGHSLGAEMAFAIAATAASKGLPSPTALMSVEPGDTSDAGVLAGRVKRLSEGVNYQQIPKAILALVLVGDEDKIVGDETSKMLFSAISQVPCENKNFVVVKSDRHGTPALIADHYAPVTAFPATAQNEGPIARLIRSRTAQRGMEQPSGQVDALDYYAYWKLLDALTDAAFYGRNRDVALGGGPNQTFMGRWSDGTPVERLQVTNDPNCKVR